jgi:hypothetical protein
MTRFYDVDAANEALIEVGPLLATLADQRTELIALRDRTLATRSTSGGGHPDEPDPDEVRRLRLRMQGVIDQMSAAVARIDALGISLRDIERGLIDFPALANGRPIWLCWRLGESEIAHWHDLDAGFGGRRPLAELS